MLTKFIKLSWLCLAFGLLLSACNRVEEVGPENALTYTVDGFIEGRITGRTASSRIVDESFSYNQRFINIGEYVARPDARLGFGQANVRMVSFQRLRLNSPFGGLDQASLSFVFDPNASTDTLLPGQTFSTSNMVVSYRSDLGNNRVLLIAAQSNRQGSDNHARITNLQWDSLGGRIRGNYQARLFGNDQLGPTPPADSLVVSGSFDVAVVKVYQ